ncbi:methyltransferase domain-containing protein [Geminocystis sp.]|uniref:methyltransferase domain-containing protein n=1 Tax=Geminocystis sp. TaxID=2664100 RepID=UPI0035946190
MLSTFDLTKFIPEELLKNAYETWQQTKAGFSLAHKNFSTEIKKVFFPNNAIQYKEITPETFQNLQGRFQTIIEEDWRDAQRGIYPVNVLFEADWQEFLQSYVKIWLDYPQTWQRMQQQKPQDFREDVNLESYPQYYRRNFHYQTDGYLSDYSANIYDLQVDILFNGIADAMRRRILKPMVERLKNVDKNSDLKILDCACGTGRTLQFLRATFPDISLYGVDLSSAYLRKANQLLSQLPHELPQLIQGNIENLPYQDNYFQGISNVFVFHELPNPIRQKVIDESLRVLQSRGVFVICDSIQLSDSPELEAMMANFPLAFHEPFYNDYIKDDIELRLNNAGFKDIEVKIYGFSKYWIATK